MLWDICFYSVNLLTFFQVNVIVWFSSGEFLFVAVEDTILLRYVEVLLITVGTQRGGVSL